MHPKSKTEYSLEYSQLEKERFLITNIEKLTLQLLPLKISEKKRKIYI